MRLRVVCTPRTFDTITGDNRLALVRHPSASHVSPDMAPIAIFAYRRTEQLSQVLDSLELCPEFSTSPVYVFSDGPRTSAAALEVENVRHLLKQRTRPNMVVVEQQANIGLAASVIFGTTELCTRYGKVIVIEDDLIVAPTILAWFNEGLRRYQNEPNIMQIAAHVFNAPRLKPLREGIFLEITTSWGWATWKRAWDQFDPEAKGWERLSVDRDLRRRFDFGGAYPYARMLENQMAGKIDSWAIRWYWSVFSAQGLTLFPPKSLVMNIGIEGQATHGNAIGAFFRKFFQKPRPPSAELYSLPESIAVNAKHRREVANAIRWRRL